MRTERACFGEKLIIKRPGRKDRVLTGKALAFISYNIEKKHRHDSEKYKKDPDYKENIKKWNQAVKELNKWEKHPDNKKTADRLHKAGLVSRHEI